MLYDYRETNVTCQQFGAILGGNPKWENNGCTVSKKRSIPITILGRPSPSVATIEFSYETVDSNGTALCLGELAVLSDEINPVLSILLQHRIPVTALHNHWLHTSPAIMYLHFETIDRPLDFAQKVSEIAKMLR
jgi:hypothetical protein